MSDIIYRYSCNCGEEFDRYNYIVQERCPECKESVTTYEEVKPEKKIRTFSTGATRNLDDNKFDFSGFLSPAVLIRYASYMHGNRRQADDTLRPSDNWKKGIPRDEYMKSMHRHFMEVWSIHDGVCDDDNIQTALCALMFNVMGYLHEDINDG